MITVGTRLGRYEIRSKIGEGGMGEVYLAEDTKLERTVALKVLPADVAADQQRMRRFVQEAKAASAFNHPNILTIHEVGEVAGINFIATEFIEGETLRQRMQGARMKLSEVLNVSIQIADALCAAHEAGIIHRDIKPENIMLRRRDAYVKVLDFGLAKLIEQPPVAVDTEAATKSLFQIDAGVVMGTALYMSPEQARGSKVDARTDIWSLGVVLYEMVAGCLPFEGSTTSEILASIINEKEPPPLARFAREVPAELERIVEKALRKDREERYQTAKDMLQDLKRLKHKLEVEAEIKRTMSPELRGAGAEAQPSEGREVISTAPGAAAHTSVAGTRTTSSVEYIAGEIKRHKRGALFFLAAVIAVTAVAYFGYWRSAGGGGAGAIRSIAVLPFTNADGNPDAEYLSDGISESLINSLSQLPNLAVKARSTVFRYKGRDADAQQIGSELNVQAVLSGRMAQRGDDLTLSLELVDAKTGDQIWGEQYDRKTTDLVALQQEIAHDVSSKLRTKLSGADEQKLAKNYTENAEAYQLYLKGRFYWNKRTPKDIQKAIEYFNQAIALDPNYALAYAGLADAYALLTPYIFSTAQEMMPKARDAATKALSLDNNLAEAHAALGLILTDYDHDFAGAEGEFKRALELNSNYATAHL